MTAARLLAQERRRELEGAVLVWAVLVWALIGGAITRIAAVQVARDEKIGLLEAVKFAARKFQSYLGAPIFPVLGIVFFAVCCLVGGWVTRIPYVGAVVGPMLWVLPLIAGFVMTIIVIGLVLAWPLMFTTISAEGSDSFDAISRSYSYLYQRPWRYGLYWMVAGVYGSVVLVFVFTFAFWMVSAGKAAAALGLSGQHTDTLFRYAPTAPLRGMPGLRADGSTSDATVRLAQGGMSEDTVPADAIRGGTGVGGAVGGAAAKAGATAGQAAKPVKKAIPLPVERRGTSSSWRRQLTREARKDLQQWEVVGAYLIAFWIGLVWLLTIGFAYSYFWSASTLIYFLLRRDVDATEMEEVYIEEEEEEDEDFGFGEAEGDGPAGAEGDTSGEPQEAGPDEADAQPDQPDDAQEGTDEDKGEQKDGEKDKED